MDTNTRQWLKPNQENIFEAMAMHVSLDFLMNRLNYHDHPMFYKFKQLINFQIEENFQEIKKKIIPNLTLGSVSMTAKSKTVLSPFLTNGSKCSIT